MPGVEDFLKKRANLACDQHPASDVETIDWLCFPENSGVRSGFQPVKNEGNFRDIFA
jgi:hypothetical protein